MQHFYLRSIMFTLLLSLATLLSAQPPWGGGGSKGPTIKGRITGTVVD